MQDTTKQLEVHPAALVLPEMDADDFRALVDDVRRNGVLMAVELHDGKILDGRHRARAAAEVGVQFDTVEVDLGDLTPEEYVWALNGARRHLTPSQRAAVAAELLPALEAEAKKRQGARTDREHCGNVATKSTGERSREKAAKLTGASPRAVQDAKRIKQDAPEQFEQIKQGKTTIAEAKRKAQPKPAKKPRAGEVSTTPATTTASHLARAYNSRSMNSKLEHAYNKACGAAAEIELHIDYLEDALLDAGMPEAACELDAATELWRYFDDAFFDLITQGLADELPAKKKAATRNKKPAAEFRYDKPEGTEAALQRMQEIVKEAQTLMRGGKFQANHFLLLKLVSELGELIQCFGVSSKGKAGPFDAEAAQASLYKLLSRQLDQWPEDCRQQALSAIEHFPEIHREPPTPDQYFEGLVSWTVNQRSALDDLEKAVPAVYEQAAAASPEVLERLARELRGLADFVATRAAEAVQ